MLALMVFKLHIEYAGLTHPKGLHIKDFYLPIGRSHNEPAWGRVERSRVFVLS